MSDVVEALEIQMIDSHVEGWDKEVKMAGKCRTWA